MAELNIYSYHHTAKQMKEDEHMANENHKPNTVGTQEAGRMLGIKPETVAKKCRNKVFPNATQYKEGTPWQIPIADIEDYIEEHYKKRK